MERLTDEMLQRLKELLAEVSPGPWKVYDENDGDFPPRPLWSIANEHYYGPEDDEVPAFQAAIYFGTKWDADFIAAARDGVPLLIAEVERLRKQVKECREALRPFAEFTYSDHWPNDERLFYHNGAKVTIGDVRRAKVVLEKD